MEWYLDVSTNKRVYCRAVLVSLISDWWVPHRTDYRWSAKTYMKAYRMAVRYSRDYRLPLELYNRVLCFGGPFHLIAGPSDCHHWHTVSTEVRWKYSMHRSVIYPFMALWGYILAVRRNSTIILLLVFEFIKNFWSQLNEQISLE